MNQSIKLHIQQEALTITGLHIKKDSAVASEINDSDWSSEFFTRTIEKEIILLCDENCDYQKVRQLTEFLCNAHRFTAEYRTYSKDQSSYNQNGQLVTYHTDIILSAYKII